MKDKLSLNCRGVAAAEVEGVFWCVMDRTGECEKFQSRVDGMVGGGGGAESACVITREDNGLVSLQVASSCCGGNRARSDLLFVHSLPFVPRTVCCYNTQIIK